MLKVLYQTVGDRGNPEEIESCGPFICNKYPWLTAGYYFWDTFIEHAHWWGQQGYRGSYVISQYQFDYVPEDVFDLLDPSYLAVFRQYAEYVEKDTGDHDITVPQVLEHMRRHTSFPYKGIRAEGRFSISYKDYPHLQILMPFIKMSYKRTSARLDLMPPVQLCLFSKDYLKKGSGLIVFPDEYINIESI